MAKAYRRPPWEFDDVPENTLVGEAEMLEVEDEIMRQMPAPPSLRTNERDVPPQFELELAEEE